MRYTYVEEKVESKSEKRIRIFLIIMNFLQVFLSTSAFMIDPSSGDNISLLQMLVQTNGYSSSAEFLMGIYGGVLILFPTVCFFFFLLDKKSKKKYAVSAVYNVLSVIMICLMIQNNLGPGAILILINNLICMFMTTQGFQATRIRENSNK